MLFPRTFLLLHLITFFNTHGSFPYPHEYQGRIEMPFYSGYVEKGFINPLCFSNDACSRRGTALTTYYEWSGAERYSVYTRDPPPLSPHLVDEARMASYVLIGRGAWGWGGVSE